MHFENELLAVSCEKLHQIFADIFTVPAAVSLCRYFLIMKLWLQWLQQILWTVNKKKKKKAMHFLTRVTVFWRKTVDSFLVWFISSLFFPERKNCNKMEYLLDLCLKRRDKSVKNQNIQKTFYFLFFYF